MGRNVAARRSNDVNIVNIVNIAGRMDRGVIACIDRRVVEVIRVRDGTVKFAGRTGAERRRRRSAYVRLAVRRLHLQKYRLGIVVPSKIQCWLKPPG
jgi:hypothetical protein